MSRKICHEVGLPTDRVLLGGQVEAMSDAELAEAAEKTTLFARLSPAHKQRIIRALQSKGHVVGFLGDGINDSPALRTADVGISVDSAVDIAKEAADIILLEKSLMVLEEGVLEGRKVFANILKYVRMGASSNFGNMFSVLGASAFVPYPADGADPDSDQQSALRFLAGAHSGRRRRPRADRQAASLAHGRDRPVHPLRRPVQFGLRLHDVLDDAVSCSAAGTRRAKQRSLFQTGWFVESLLTQTLIIHIIRTNRIPFLQSRASWPLMVTTAIIMAVGVWLPSSPDRPVARVSRRCRRSTGRCCC